MASYRNLNAGEALNPIEPIQRETVKQGLKAKEDTPFSSVANAGWTTLQEPYTKPPRTMYVIADKNL